MPGSTPVRAAELDRLLASRALHRLEYAKLLEFTPDPFGDWTAGRLDRLVQAELESTGLRMPSLGAGVVGPGSAPS
jgi:hypothetical protein